MNNFVRCNKVSGVYWLKASVENLKIKVKLKPPDDILSLPKFEEYTNEHNSINVQPITEEYSFVWQEKSFSAYELHQFSDIHNCLTESEAEYHEFIKNHDVTPHRVFTYIHEDAHLPLPCNSKKHKTNSKIEQCIEYFINTAVGTIEATFGGKTDSMSHLLKSRESLWEDDKWTTMHIVFDHSDTNEEILLKQETTLFSIYHNKSQNYVILAPDVNNLELNPYTIDGSVPVNFTYGVSVEFGEMGAGEELETLLTSLYARWEKKHKHLVNFIMPPVGTTHYYVTLDLMSAGGFEVDKLYIQYTIKVAEGVHCGDTLHGRTHTSEPPAEGERCNFGHLVELCLDTDMSDPPPIKLYLEAISTSSSMHRTEGYIHLPISLSAGLRTLALTCLRPEDRSWRGEEMRFFKGGCNVIEDLEVLASTDGQNSDFIYTQTGTVHLRYSIISQSGAAAAEPSVGPSTGSALLLGAEAALDKYRRARKRLAEATRDLGNITLSGDG